MIGRHGPLQLCSLTLSGGEQISLLVSTQTHGSTGTSVVFHGIPDPCSQNSYVHQWT